MLVAHCMYSQEHAAILALESVRPVDSSGGAAERQGTRRDFSVWENDFDNQLEVFTLLTTNVRGSMSYFSGARNAVWYCYPIQVQSVEELTMQVVLGSWKEIANYLGKGVRTVQRWERCSGLPIHRPSGSSKGVVLAFPAELDRWARRQDGKVTVTAQVPDFRHMQKNLALSQELIEQSKLLRTGTRELIDSCSAFVKLSRAYRDHRARERREHGSEPYLRAG
jgi:hypothetical protein